MKHLFEILKRLSKFIIVEYGIFINSIAERIEGRRIEILYGSPSSGLWY